MKRVLVLYYTQSGQLRDIVDSVVGPLQASPEFEVVLAELRPVEPFPFPWPFWRFFNIFPETVWEDVQPIHPPDVGDNPDFDLVILAYQVWFLSPSQPVTAFLQSPDAARLLAGKPVVTLIGCRDMWLMAQEQIKRHLARLDAHLLDNIVLIDSAHTFFTFISTPAWMLTGRRGPFLWGLVPPAGVTQQDISDAARFGRAIADQFPARSPDDHSPMLNGLGAVRIQPQFIAPETIARRSFRIWGKLLRKLGPPSAITRRIALSCYLAFLLTMICTVVPISTVVKRLLAPLTRARTQRLRATFAAPSGESTERLPPRH